MLPLVSYLRERPDVLLSALDHANVAAVAARWLARTRCRRFPASMRPTRRASPAATNRPPCGWPCGGVTGGADAVVTVSQGAADDMVRTTGVPARWSRDLQSGDYTEAAGTVARAIGPCLVCAGPAAGDFGSRQPGGRPRTFPRSSTGLPPCDASATRGSVVLGEGPERGPLERIVRELGLTEVVSMPGFVTNPYAYMARCALYVLSSAWEMLPTVLIEAPAPNARGWSRPTARTAREILQGGRYGQLVPVGDAAALARAMRGALDGPRPEVPSAVLLPFTVDAATDRYAEVIAEVFHARVQEAAGCRLCLSITRRSRNQWHNADHCRKMCYAEA